MTSWPYPIVVAIVYGSREYGLAILSGEHLYRAEVRGLDRTRDPASHFERQLTGVVTRYVPSIFCEVVTAEHPGALKAVIRPILTRASAAAGGNLVTMTRDELRARHCTPPARASNDGVGRAVLREYPELAARYGPPEALGRTSHPTSRERYQYLLFLAVAGAQAALYSNIVD